MSRKGENIYKRKDGRWEGRYIKGRTPDRKPVYHSIYGYTYRDVKARLILLKQAYGEQPPAKNVYNGTVTEWFRFWLEEEAGTRIKTSTYASYRTKISRHILPVLGAFRLQDLTDRQIQDFVNSLTEKGLAPGSVSAIFRILSSCIQSAVDKNYLFINPCRRTLLPKKKTGDIPVLSLKKQKQLEAEAGKTTFGRPILLALYTGMRIGEISGLKWSDIDFDEKVIRVQRTLQRVTVYGEESKTKILVDRPKSHSSLRRIPLADHLCHQILSWKKESDSEYVISCQGSFAEPRTIAYRFHTILKAAGIPKIPFHTLRHTFATRCMERGIDAATLSRLLGHSSIKMTLDTYAHSTLDQRRLAMDLLDRMMPESIQDIQAQDRSKETAIEAIKGMLKNLVMTEKATAV